MNILVPVKSVLDYAAKVKPLPDGSGVQEEGIKKIINPFDEIAVEEAIKLKEAGVASKVTVVSIGKADAVSQLRYAMAMGADEAILVQSETSPDSLLAAKILQKVYHRESFQLVIMGKLAIDSDSGQTPQMLATLLDLPFASYASKVTVDAEGKVAVTREIDGGLENVLMNLPAVISTDLRLNEPRYAPLPGIMKAKKKPLTELSLTDLEITEQSQTTLSNFKLPAERSAGIVVENVDQLLVELKNKQLV